MLSDQKCSSNNFFSGRFKISLILRLFSPYIYMYVYSLILSSSMQPFKLCSAGNGGGGGFKDFLFRKIRNKIWKIWENLQGSCRPSVENGGLSAIGLKAWDLDNLDRKDGRKKQIFSKGIKSCSVINPNPISVHFSVDLDV